MFISTSGVDTMAAPWSATALNSSASRSLAWAMLMPGPSSFFSARAAIARFCRPA
jgi:hypothetical protein